MDGGVAVLAEFTKMTGRTISEYGVVEELGSGMGDYRGNMMRLDGIAGLKVGYLQPYRDTR
jgi:hypothetical protein